MSEVVETHGIGVSVELGDVEELAQALVMFLQSHAKRTRFAHNCEKTRSQFVFELYQKSICAAYEGL